MNEETQHHVREKTFHILKRREVDGAVRADGGGVRTTAKRCHHLASRWTLFFSRKASDETETNECHPGSIIKATEPPRHRAAKILVKGRLSKSPHHAGSQGT